MIPQRRNLLALFEYTIMPHCSAYLGNAVVKLPNGVKHKARNENLVAQRPLQVHKDVLLQAAARLHLGALLAALVPVRHGSAVGVNLGGGEGGDEEKGRKRRRKNQGM